MHINSIYYSLKAFIPRWIQIALRRKLVMRKRLLYTDVWPIDQKAGTLPERWVGWPDQKQFALVLAHDVDTAKGQQNCHNLITLEKECGFRSAFYFVPRRYGVPPELISYLKSNGFEIGVHGLYHDGRLFESWNTFKKRAVIINNYLKTWEAVGFGSPSNLRNFDWIRELNIEYDCSSFDTDPFEPQPDGIGTIFPVSMDGKSNQNGFIELPYTIPQDFTLFVLMKEKNIDIWKRKIDWIIEKGGMALLLTHPDYMSFNSKKMGVDQYPAKHYANFLEYIKVNYEGLYWHVLPKEMARYWSHNIQKPQ